MGAVRVLVADDNPIVRAGLVALLGLDDAVEVCGEASSGPEALAATRCQSPDVVLLDVRMPGGDGLSVLAELSTRTRVLMLTYSDEPEVVSTALARGATGYLVHGTFDGSELLTAVKDTAAGRVRLSPPAAAVLLARPLAPSQPVLTATLPAAAPTALESALAGYNLSRRELDVCELLVSGAGNAEIAEALFIEPKTVKNHINHIFAKLGVSTRAQAIARCLGTTSVDHR